MMTAVLAGLASGAVYALIAIGYNITLVSSGVLNFAFANTLVLGGYLAFGGLTMGLPVPLAILFAVVGCAIVSIVLERAAIRFMPTGGHAELITTLGAGTVITGITALVWGSDPVRIVLFDQQPVEILGGRTQPIALILVGLAVVLGIGLHLLLRHTSFGLTSRAQAFDREATMVRGVDVRWLSIIAFGIAGLFAGLVGPFVLMYTTASPWLAIIFALKGFVALALGGLGSQIGAVIAGFIVGLVEAFVALLLGSFFGDYAVFVVFLLVLVFRPRGLMGTRSLRTV